MNNKREEIEKLPYSRRFILDDGQQMQKYFPFWEPVKRGKTVCEMKVLFTITYIQYAIGLQLYLSIDKVTESGFQAIKVSGDVEKLVIVFILERSAKV